MHSESAPQASPAGLTGNRAFTWFTPAKRKATEYENYTVGLQSTPDRWIQVDWPVRYDDGRAPWVEEASAVRSSLWHDFRDPHGVWQRPYVSRANQDLQTLARLQPVLVGTTGGGTGPWPGEVLARVYAAWPFVEHGLFLALSYAIRQAMSDTVQFSVVFQAMDRMRLLQDIVLHLDQLTETTGLSDADARHAWMTDPTLVPVRELVEAVNVSEDWMEILVVAALVFEPIVGRLAKEALFASLAPRWGDSATPLVMAGALRDADRHVETVQALVRHVVADPARGPANAGVVAGWAGQWTPRIVAAAEAFLPVLVAAGLDDRAADDELRQLTARQEALLAAAVKA